MSSKVAVIGAGHVGATIAYTLTVTGAAAEIVLIDINEKKAFGEAMDIRQGTAYCNPSNVYSGTYADAKGADIVIITSGVARKAGQSRLELSQINTDIIKQIAPKITKYAPDAIYVIVANPVDILTYVFTKVSGIPQNRVLGSGTLLDTARLRTSLSEYYNVSQKNVHAYVFGEHGDTSFIPWSISTISSININQYHDCFFNDQPAVPPVDRKKIWEYVKNSGGTIIANKGATYYAVSIVTAQIVLQRGHLPYRNQHDERRIRHKRCLPVHPRHRQQQGYQMQGSHPADPGRNGTSPEERRQPQECYQRS